MRVLTVTNRRPSLGQDRLRRAADGDAQPLPAKGGASIERTVLRTRPIARFLRPLGSESSTATTISTLQALRLIAAHIAQMTTAQGDTPPGKQRDLGRALVDLL